MKQPVFDRVLARAIKGPNLTDKSKLKLNIPQRFEREDGKKAAEQQKPKLSLRSLNPEASEPSSGIRRLAPPGIGLSSKKTVPVTLSSSGRSGDRYEAMKAQLQLAGQVMDWETAMEVVTRGTKEFFPEESVVGSSANLAASASTSPNFGLKPRGSDKKESLKTNRALIECIGLAASICAKDGEEECVAWLLDHPALWLEKQEEPSQGLTQSDSASKPNPPSVGISTAQFLRLAQSAQRVGAHQSVVKMYDRLYGGWKGELPPSEHGNDSEEQDGDVFTALGKRPSRDSVAVAVASCEQLGDWQKAMQIVAKLAPSPTPEATPSEEGKGNAKAAHRQRMPLVGATTYAILLSLLEKESKTVEAKQVLLAMPIEDQKQIAKAYSQLIVAWGAEKNKK